MNKTSNVNRYDYKEAEALQQLLVAIDKAQDDAYKQFTINPYLTDMFTITVNGQSIAFILGGPQTTALHNFIQHIADENLYEVDFEQLTVK